MKKIALLVILVVVVFTSCTKKAAKQEGKTLRILTRDCGYPTPYAHYPRGPGYLLTSLIFDSLVWKDQNGFVPWLCSEWKEDGRTWSFNMREGVMWHDGKPLTAEDVKFTFTYMKEYPYHWNNLSIIEDVEIPEPGKVVFVLKKQSPQFLTNIAGAIPIIPKHIWQNIKNPVNFISEKAFVGSGPFILSKYEQAKAVYIFKANKSFFMGMPRIDNLIFMKAGKPEFALRQGDVDGAILRNGKSLKLFKGKKRFKVLPLDHSMVIRLMLNTEVYPLKNQKFRQALAYIINRKEMVKRVMHGHAEVGKMGYFPSDSTWYNPDVFQYLYSPKKAKALLKELQYIDIDRDGFVEAPDGKPFTLEILGISGEWGPAYTRVNELIRQNLKKAGIRCKVKILDVSTRDSLIDRKSYQVAINLGGGLLGDPEYLQRKNRRWIPYTQGSPLARLIKQEVVERDEKTRKKILFKIQEEFSKQVLTIPLFYPNWYFVYNHEKFDRWFLTWRGIAFGIPLPFNKAVWLSK